MKKKLVIIINGKGGTGKDTVCDIAAAHYKVRNVSAIDPIKEIARHCGWTGEKDAKARRFLSELKRVCVDYNDLPNRFLEEQYRQFLDSDEDLMFAHCREADQIDDLKKRIRTKCVTLLVHSDDRSQGAYGNASDDQAEDYPYDYRYVNDKPLTELEGDFMAFLQDVLEKEGVLT